MRLEQAAVAWNLCQGITVHRRGHRGQEVGPCRQELYSKGLTTC